MSTPSPSPVRAPAVTEPLRVPVPGLLPTPRGVPVTEPVKTRHVPVGRRGAGYFIQRFFQNFLGCWPLVLGLIVLVPTVSIPVLLSRDGWGMRLAYRGFQWWCRATARGFGIRIYGRGLENVDRTRPYILAVNHRSHLDIVAIGPLLPVFMIAIYKKSLEYIPFIGQALILSRSVGLNRKDHAESKRRLALVGHRMRLGRSVLVFPEGTRSRGEKLDAFKKGAAVVALEQGAAVLPITISGSDALYPPGNIMVNPGEILVEVHAPIETAGRPATDRDALTRQLQDVIGSTFEAGPLRPERTVGATRFV